MDVHAPHHPLNNWKDFFIHLATITVGLLIALALENAAEALHHRHLVREARENIRREMADNEKASRDDIGYVQTNADNMLSNMHRLVAVKQNPQSLAHSEMHFTFEWSSFNDSAWRSARDTGALSYMPVAEAQQDADVYNQQAIVNTEAISIFTHQSELAAPLLLSDGPDHMDPADVHKLALDCAITNLRLQTLRQLTEILQKQYATTRKN